MNYTSRSSLLHCASRERTRLPLRSALSLALISALMGSAHAAPGLTGEISTTDGDPLTLDAVKVRAERVDETPAASSVASRIAIKPREIPQSVGVISGEQIQAQQLDNVRDALKQAQGVSLTNVDTSRYKVYARGFTIDTIQIDGIASPITGYMTPQNLAMFERVEVLLGPSGLLSGPGGAGGAINLVRKLPHNQFSLSAQQVIGTDDLFRSQVDLGGPLNASGSLRGRAVAAVDNHDLEADTTHRSDSQIYGVVEGDIGTGGIARVGASYQRMHSHSMQYGYPTYSDGRFLDIDVSKFYGLPTDDEIYRLKTIFAEYEQAFDNGWTGKVSASLLDSDRETTFAGLRGALEPGSSLTQLQSSTSGAPATQRVLDMFAAGPFALFGRTHQLTVGANYLSDDQESHGAPGNWRYFDIDLNDPVTPATLPTYTAKQSRSVTRTRQSGAYANARFSISDPLTLVTGVRGTWWKATITPDAIHNANAVKYTSDSIAGHVTPFAGIIYDFGENYSAYVSDTRVFAPQSERDANGELLKPLEGEQYEAGVKGAWLDDRLNASLALFQLTQSNRAVADNSDPANVVYFAQGKARSRGVDLQVHGTPAPSLQISAGYTFTDTKYLDESADTGKNSFSAYTPRHLLKSWAEYRPSGRWSRFSVNGAVLASSGVASEGKGWLIQQRGYATVDLGFGYDYSEHLRLTLNASNLFDRTYWQSVSTPNDHNYLGEGRRITLGARVAF